MTEKQLEKEGEFCTECGSELLITDDEMCEDCQWDADAGII